MFRKDLPNDQIVRLMNSMDLNALGHVAKALIVRDAVKRSIPQTCFPQSLAAELQDYMTHREDDDDENVDKEGMAWLSRLPTISDNLFIATACAISAVLGRHPSMANKQGELLAEWASTTEYEHETDLVILSRHGVFMLIHDAPTRFQMIGCLVVKRVSWYTACYGGYRLTSLEDPRTDMVPVDLP